MCIRDRTTHIVYGEAMGILAGDALLNYAFETAVKAFEIAPEKSLLIGKALKILAEKAGIYGMIGGQVVDVASCGVGLDEGMLNFIYELKTGALIESSDVYKRQLVAQAKVNREQVRAKNKETLQAIIDNADIAEDQKADAVAQMVEMTQRAEQEVAIETLLASKGFQDAVVSLTEESADVVVDAVSYTHLTMSERIFLKKRSMFIWKSFRIH